MSAWATALAVAAARSGCAVACVIVEEGPMSGDRTERDRAASWLRVIVEAQLLMTLSMSWRVVVALDA